MVDENEMLGSGPADVEIDDSPDDSVPRLRYEITSYGVDFDVEGLCRRLQREEIVIPGFQRNYVWDRRRASKFIESLLLGLPVPGIFLSKDFETGKFMVIDGQQRLKSIQFFYDGQFKPASYTGRPRDFKLTGVQERFDGMTYDKLSYKDKMELDNALIHATVVKQDLPPNDDTSMYQIFERINTQHLRLSSQEIRSALYQGKFVDLLGVLNDHPSWRSIFGKPHSRQRDQELILRFLAFFFAERPYQRPMSEFLTQFIQRNRNPQDEFLARSADIFRRTMDAFDSSIGVKSFRPERAFNAAVFDSMSVGLARRIESSGVMPTPNQMKKTHRNLLSDQEYRDSVSSMTSDERYVKIRMERSIDCFAAL